MSNSELDKIIGEGKVNQATAMVIFAVELKQQGERIEELKVALAGDNDRYMTKSDFNTLEKRVSRVENAILGALIFVFIAFAGAVIGLVVKR